VGAVVAGWAAGYLMGVATTIAAVYLLVHVDTRRLLDRVIDPNVARPLIGVPVFVGATLAWTMVGLVLGSIYHVGSFAEGRGALGAPSIAFAAGMVVIGILPVPIIAALWLRFWWLWLGMGLLFALTFGWAMPVLAEQW
jgi:hypothetical protein